MVEKFREGEVGLLNAIDSGALFEYVADGIAMVGHRQMSSGEINSKSVDLKLRKESSLLINRQGHFSRDAYISLHDIHI